MSHHPVLTTHIGSLELMETLQSSVCAALSTEEAKMPSISSWLWKMFLEYRTLSREKSFALT
jgi:hypothetical protein